MALVIDSVQATHQLAVSLSEALDVGSRRYSGTFQMEGAQFTVGTATDQIEKVGIKQVVVNASSDTTLDLNADFLDPFGNVQNFAKIKSIHAFLPISPTYTQTTSAVLFDTVTNGFTQPALPVAAGDGFVYRRGAGVTVTGGSNDKLKITNADATNKCTVNIVIMGN